MTVGLCGLFTKPAASQSIIRLGGLSRLFPVASSDSDAEATVKILDKIANLAILLAVAVFLTLVIRGEFSRHTAAPAPSPGALVGKTRHSGRPIPGTARLPRARDLHPVPFLQ